MMDADAFAFFQSTIGYFIDFKAKKNSPDWIWERVRNNVKRLRPHLRSKAAQCIEALPQQTLFKMNVDWKELTHLCAPSGRQSECPSDDAVSLSGGSFGSLPDPPDRRSTSPPSIGLKSSELNVCTMMYTVNNLKVRKKRKSVDELNAMEALSIDPLSVTFLPFLQ